MRYYLLAFFMIMSTSMIAEDTLSTDAIYVPINYEALKILYIKAVQMYYRESDAHKKTLDTVKVLLVDNSNMIAKLKNISTNGNYVSPFWKNYVTVSVGASFTLTERMFGVGVGYLGVLKDKWVFGVDAIYPSFLGSRFGFGF